jgi:4-hydroxy-tetrahydrodipicolinate synthase
MMRGQSARWGHLVTAMATPMDAEGRILPEQAGKLARYLLENGSDAVVVNGTTGESPTTSADEKIMLVRAVVEAVGSARVIAGAGGNDTAEIVELARRSKSAGAGAILSVAPYYNKPSQEGLYRHFRAIAEAVSDLPVILYNVPARTITNIDASTTSRLARDVPNIVATKEASANMAQVAEIARTTPDTFDIYSGDDATILPTLALGGAGVISVISHVCGPDLAALHRAWFAGDREGALCLFLKTLPLTRALFAAPSPAPTKHALNLLGQPVGGVRLPLVDLTDQEGAALRAALREYGLPA